MGHRNFIVATAGHVDHGKSSLVKALTQTDPDRLPEEKKRGITIELGFAHLKLAAADGDLNVGIIDVPGHEDFVQNMVMGVGAADAALLVVAADDGWMPQTEEHLQILAYLGVRRGLIAITKTDLPEADPELTMEMVKEEVKGTPFETAPIVATSVVKEAGLDALRSELARLLITNPERPASRARMWVDRAFTMRGSGTIVTGTVEGAPFTAGQSVFIQPRNVPARIRGLQSFGTAVEQALPGTRTAINLPDIDVSAEKGKPHVSRGDAIVPEGKACETVDVMIHKSDRRISERSPANQPLKHGARVRLHLGTSSTPARIHFPSDEPLLPGGSAVAQLRCESPVYAREGDRFTLRDWPETATLAGGQILEIDAERRTFRRVPQQQFLRARMETGDVSVWIASVLERDGFAPRSNLLRQSVFAPGEIERAIDATPSGRPLGDWLVNPQWHQELHEAVRKTLSAWHGKRPELPGYPLVKLRAMFAKGCPENLLSALFADFDGVSVTGNWAHESDHVPQLQPELEQPCAELRAALAENPNEPPSCKHLLTTPAHQRALKFLINIGEIVELDADNVLGAGVHAAMRRQVIDHLRAHGATTTSALRQLIGTSRRIAMPLLERMDKEGITLRNGDSRTLRRSGADGEKI